MLHPTGLTWWATPPGYPPCFYLMRYSRTDGNVPVGGMVKSGVSVTGLSVRSPDEIRGIVFPDFVSLHPGYGIMLYVFE